MKNFLLFLTSFLQFFLSPSKGKGKNRPRSPRGRSGRVWKISLPTGIRWPDSPARSESLYRLSYPGPLSFSLYFHLLSVISQSLLFLRLLLFFFLRLFLCLPALCLFRPFFSSELLLTFFLCFFLFLRFYLYLSPLFLSLVFLFFILSIFQIRTWVLIAPAWYSWSPCFRSCLKYRLSWQFCAVFLSSSRQMTSKRVITAPLQLPADVLSTSHSADVLSTSHSATRCCIVWALSNWFPKYPLN